MLTLAIVIINYKTPGLVKAVLESLKSEIDANSMQVIVVDNDSQDDSLSLLSVWIQENHAATWVRLIDAGHNTGFSGGNNIGIRSLKAKNYLLLNSDTIVRQGAISLLLEAAERNTAVGMVSPRLEWEDTTPQESCFRFHSPISELIRSSSTRFITKLFSKYVVPQPVTSEPGFYQWTSFACVLIKAEVFEQIGLLDDEFFMYFEDVEFSYRAVQAGWKVLNIPQAHVVHLRGGSSPLKSQAKLRKRLPRYFYESRTRYFYLVYGHVGLLVANLLWTFGAIIAHLRSIVSKQYQSNIAEKQWRDTWINFLKPTRNYIHPKNYDKT
ncbi:glycosyltransferase family 2 protein [Methylophaga sp.]|uniref:glycosyltransferase family 2 protein n=1 Tax=Methylophaga sp. TaxID=2024840 RepID=UPI00271F5748|nr:glycosyltransferase family 2 protein [Methylophaga sp.]MDO8825456.1 glycosyltransferase family 2 protein [Methylophaga sp.]